VTFTLSILNPATKEVLDKATFSKLFNREVHSWGKNNFVILCMCIPSLPLSLTLSLTNTSIQYVNSRPAVNLLN
jgi:hypothetical protein